MRSTWICGVPWVLLLQRTFGDAQSLPAYAHNSIVSVNHTNWMASVPGYIRISNLSIPGTHDTGSLRQGGDLVLTQSLAIASQLQAGIRALDIRLGIDTPLSVFLSGSCPKGLCIFHSIFYQQQSWHDDVLGVVRSFLQANPSESVLMRVRQENGDISNFAGMVESEMTSFPPTLFYNGTDMNPTLEMIRGKIVILYDYTADSGTRGIPYNSFNIQDNFNLDNNKQLAIKWNDVRNQLIAANTDKTTTTRYINFFTAAGASVLPYFVASGKTGPADNDGALLTGFVACSANHSCSGGNLCIPEYPRVHCVASGCCQVAYDGINNMARNFIIANVTVRTGIVMMDFPGPGLIEAIIQVSWKLGGSSSRPTRPPTRTPVKPPTRRPTRKPTHAPTLWPTPWPTTLSPTPWPTTLFPTSLPPSPFPTNLPTRKPTKRPTKRPTSRPTTRRPTRKPVRFPTRQPSVHPR